MAEMGSYYDFILLGELSHSLSETKVGWVQKSDKGDCLAYKSLWNSGENVNIIYIYTHTWYKTWCNNRLPPPIKKMPRRPKKRRKLELTELRRDEMHLRKVSLPKKCSRCHKYEHNKSICKESPIHTIVPTQLTKSTQDIASAIQITTSINPLYQFNLLTLVKSLPPPKLL
ncbi:hypothetical protein CR513_22492, partial [Mucuna pruriens]